MAVYRIEVRRRDASCSITAADLRAAGLGALRSVRCSRLFLIEGALSRQDAEAIARGLLADPVDESASVHEAGEPLPDEPLAFEIHPLPGVMDPVAQSTLEELLHEGYQVSSVRTARRYVLDGALDRAEAEPVVRRVLANACIEQVAWGAVPIAPAPQPPQHPFRVRHVALRERDDAALGHLSRQRHLFLNLDEMRAVRAYFREQRREPTDLELETIAQTWSEHCVHKTLRGEVQYEGAPFGARPADGAARITCRYANLLADTIGRATRELTAEGRGPECLSVFEDNAGVIGFNDRFGIAVKVETHNHPSAIEPYGGAATGVGGCIRDILGCGLGARPIAGTDVFCVAPQDWPADALPRGVLHPARVLRGVVRGVGDYGNRMGIPTVNGALVFDPRYLGNPLVYCGCVGLLPRDRVRKAAQPGDYIVLIGGRTGRDGIHGATFSSAELTDGHADRFAHAVQIGNPITEKRVLEALLRARDDDGGLFHAVTDCGAGGLSSAVGEMGAAIGAEVNLERVPLKYSGLRYDEIWISEAQERMVLAVPPERLERLLAIAREEEVEATPIGRFGCLDDLGRPRLRVRYRGTVVGDLDMEFLHHGLPRRARTARWHGATDSGAPARQPSGSRTPQPQTSVRAAERSPRGSFAPSPADGRDEDLLRRLLRALATPNVRSRAWIVRQYDHEVQAATVIKPLGGPGAGPNDAAVLQPVPDDWRGVAVGCGLAPHLSDVDPYWMALASMDEAVRNVVSVGGDPNRTALLDNFCWPGTDESEADDHGDNLGALVRACQACYDGAKAYGTPFISGKDSLNNAYALDARDVEPLLERLRRYVAPERFARLAEHIRRTGRLEIPGTLLITAVRLVDDIRRCTSADLKPEPGTLVLVGGLPQVGFSLDTAAAIHAAVAAAIRDGLVRACHDVGDGGWLVALAEMAIGGLRGFEVADPNDADVEPFADLCAAYVTQTPEPETLRVRLRGAGVSAVTLGVVRDEPVVNLAGASLPLAALRRAWSGENPPTPPAGTPDCPASGRSTRP